MRPLLRISLVSIALALYCTGVLSHDDLAAQEKELRHGYQIGYITAVRDFHEGSLMCTKDISLLEVIQTIGAYNKAKGIPVDVALSTKNITEALSAKYKCKAK